MSSHEYRRAGHIFHSIGAALKEFPFLKPEDAGSVFDLSRTFAMAASMPMALQAKIRTAFANDVPAARKLDFSELEHSLPSPSSSPPTLFSHSTILWISSNRLNSASRAERCFGGEGVSDTVMAGLSSVKAPTLRSQAFACLISSSRRLAAYGFQ